MAEGDCAQGIVQGKALALSRSLKKQGGLFWARRECMSWLRASRQSQPIMGRRSILTGMTSMLEVGHIPLAL